MNHRRDSTEWRGLGTDVGVVLVWFVIAACISGLLWWQITPLAEWTRTAKNATMGEPELKRQFAMDGWFFVISAAGGLVSGLVLARWRRRDPVALVALLLLGAGLASFLMARLGFWLGPEEVKQALATASTGQKVPVQLQTLGDAVYLAWPLATMLGAVIVLWGTDGRVASDTSAPTSSISG